MADTTLAPLIMRSLAAASTLEWAILALLAVLSVVSWTIIVAKARMLREVRRQHQHFEQLLTTSRHVGELEARLADTTAPSLLRAALLAGAQAHRHPTTPTTADGQLSLHPVHEPGRRIRLIMDVAVVQARQDLQRHLSFLATAGSAAPFIGLLGTVWGIMGTFQTLGDAKNASLQVLAPPIAAALIATAAGLAVAIPAVMAYNALQARLQSEEEFATSIIERLAHIFSSPVASSTTTES